MSDPQSNSEIMDVLSSIRRLVSEARKPVAVPDPTESAADAPTLRLGGRFVLTPALRVAEPGDLPPEETPQDPQNATPDERRQEAEAGGMAAPARPASGGSLEETIAELEAAVSEIGADFEPEVESPPVSERSALPDPQEVISLTPPPPAAAPGMLTSAQHTPDSVAGFPGIMAGFDAMALPEDRLDVPITADGLGADLPPLPGADAWRRVAREPRDAEIDTPPDADQPTLDPVPALFRRARHMPLETGGPIETGGHDSLVADSTAEGRGGESGTDRLAREADGPDAAYGSADSLIFRPDAPEMTQQSADDAGFLDESALPAAEDDAPGMTSAADGAAVQPDLSGNRLHFGATGSSPRLRIERPSEEVLLEDDGLDATSEPYSQADADADADADDQIDLFDPLATSEIDVEVLRDMVTEIIREELRGMLGEKITRNLRRLVRREIGRALAASAGEKD